MKTVTTKLYKKHKDAVIRLSLAVQNYDGKTYHPKPYSDKEIAEKLGLTEKEVIEIRCIAEVDVHSSNTWMEADIFKNKRAKAHATKSS